MNRPFEFVIDNRFTNEDTFELYLFEDINYDFSIDWGDGSISSISNNDKSCSHVYKNKKKYTIKIWGNVEVLHFSWKSKKQIVYVLDLGDCNWKSLNAMFLSCSNLISFRGGVTSSVADMSRMFYRCSSLHDLDLSSFNTSNVTNINSMFSGCTSLENLNLLNFNTSNVLTMSFVFNKCSSLLNLDLSSFNTSKVTSMDLMFNRCTSLDNLNLSSFNTLNVSDMTGMFRRTFSIKYLDLTNFCFNSPKIQNFCKLGPKKIIVKRPYKKKYFKKDENVFSSSIDISSNLWINSLTD
jgi:surface protein